jgi:N6-L-threonylcarbamoyladenine synthase/protein kinase Bud32
MLVLGIESTAHTLGVGVVRDGEVLSNERDMYVPEEGGIHPREAADHHVKTGNDTVSKALKKAGIEEKDLDLVAFSQGPGLGPCLRVGATIARVISLKNRIPIVGVNHCVAHLEIGRSLGARDPVLLYASGANTQVIAFVKGRYRVLGETLDIGIGNMLDKLGRELGMPFPAGPKIEKLARGELIEGVWERDVDNIGFLELPYSVKGMDVSFSGIMTAALSLKEKGHDIPSICHSVQETCFSMLCEVAERAMAHIGADEVLLGGGVACNSRFQEMASKMALQRGARSYAPPRGLLVDNGAMIAFLGEIMFRSGISHRMENTVIDQKFRTDQVDVTWKENREIGQIRANGVEDVEVGLVPPLGSVIGRGAEAVLTMDQIGNNPVVVKKREPKSYRINELENRLSTSRIKKEVKMIKIIRDIGVRTPYILDVDLLKMEITMEFLKGPRLASILNILEMDHQTHYIRRMGEILGQLHRNDIVHGDMTTSNFIIMDRIGGDLGLIDLSLSDRTEEIERKGVDVRLFFEVFSSTHPSLLEMSEVFWEGYCDNYDQGEAVRKKTMDINSRGRYMSQNWT